jgi:hypothetical protein
MMNTMRNELHRAFFQICGYVCDVQLTGGKYKGPGTGIEMGMAKAAFSTLYSEVVGDLLYYIK